MISIASNGFQLFMNYMVAVIVAIVLALVLKLPLIPERPIRFSWTKSAIFPTPIFAIGTLAIFYSLNIYWVYNGLLIAIILGLFSALFVKYLFDYIFLNPNEAYVNKENNNNSTEDALINVSNKKGDGE